MKLWYFIKAKVIVDLSKSYDIISTDIILFDVLKGVSVWHTDASFVLNLKTTTNIISGCFFIKE